MHKQARFTGWHKRKNLLVENYQSGKEQRANVGSAFSNLIKVTNGVMQGSVMRPQILLIFVNDLPEGLRLYMSVFVEAVRLMRGIRSTQDCSEHDRLQLWSDTLFIRYNLTK